MKVKIGDLVRINPDPIRPATSPTPSSETWIQIYQQQPHGSAENPQWLGTPEGRNFPIHWLEESEIIDHRPLNWWARIKFRTVKLLSKEPSVLL